MQASDLVKSWRRIIAEPYQDRWTDDDALAFASDAQRDMARELRCIEGRRGIQTQVNQPLYALPPVVAVQRVYMAGPGFAQRIKHTSIGQMEGDDLRLYGSNGPNFTPQWMTLPPAPYPVSSCARGVGYTPLPMFPGNPPEYYLRGIGAIGIVPTPQFVYNLVLDIIELPGELETLEDDMMFDLDFRESMSWYMASLAYHSDQSVGADSLEADALANYQRCLNKKQDFVKNFNEDDPDGPLLLTHRTFYQPTTSVGGNWEG